DRSSSAYRELGLEVLKRFVKALQAIERRQKGEVVETPELIESSEAVSPLSGSLRAAHEGWKKSRNPSRTTLREFTYAIDRFVELHGDMPVAKITRRDVLHFREALQDLPIRRSGKLRNAPLPELVEWSKHHPRAPRVSNATVNKLLGGVQAVALWARDNGDLGITNRASVFHSFRHGFKDALRAAEVSEDVNDALTGQAGPGTVGRQYGAKQLIRRFGITTLSAAVSKVAYPGLDLSHLTYLPSEESGHKRGQPLQRPQRQRRATKEPPAGDTA